MIDNIRPSYNPFNILDSIVMQERRHRKRSMEIESLKESCGSAESESHASESINTN